MSSGHRLALAAISTLICLLLSAFASAAPKWRTAEVDGFVIFSNESPRATRQIVEELRDARSIFQKLFPSFKADNRIPLRVIVCRGNFTLKQFAPLYDGKPKELGGLFFNSHEGPNIVINAGSEREYTRRTVYHEYVHYLASNANTYIPPWLGEGLAELFSTIKSKKDGKVEVGNPIPESVLTFQKRKPIPFDRFFQISHGSPEYNSSKHGSGQFYAQSWLFLHYMKYGNNDLPPNALAELVSRTISGDRVDENMIQEVLGTDFKTLGKNLREYSQRGRFTQFIYSLDKHERDFELELEEINEGQEDLLLGSLVLRFRTPRDAYPYLARAVEKLPNSPLAFAYQGYHAIAQEQYERALKDFGKAIELGSQSPYTLLNYATTWLQVNEPSNSIRKGRISKEDTIKLLTHLFKSRELAGGFDPRLYQAIGQVWLRSAVTPTDAHMEALVEGLKRYPSNGTIGFLLAIYFERTEQYQLAQDLVDRFYPENVSGQALSSFRSLGERLSKKLTTAAAGSS